MLLTYLVTRYILQYEIFYSPLAVIVYTFYHVDAAGLNIQQPSERDFQNNLKAKTNGGLKQLMQ